MNCRGLVKRAMSRNLTPPVLRRPPDANAPQCLKCLLPPVASDHSGSRWLRSAPPAGCVARFATSDSAATASSSTAYNRQVGRSEAGQPARDAPASRQVTGGDRPCRSRKPDNSWRACTQATLPPPVEHARDHASASLRLIEHTGVGSPALCSVASLPASRRSVLTRSPGLRGINDGATTTHSCPRPASCRWMP